MKMRIYKTALIIPFLLSSYTVSAETCAGAVSVSCCSDVSSSSGETCAIPANNNYTFTLKRFGFEDSAGNITWMGSTTSFNAANASVGASMGAFISGTPLAIGTYVAVRPEVKLVMTVNGSGVSTSDDIACTTGGDKTEDLADVMTTLGATMDSCTDSPNANSCDTGDGFMRMRDTSLGDITITASSSPTITFKFDVGSGVMFSATGGACTYANMGPLDVSMTLAN